MAAHELRGRNRRELLEMLLAGNREHERLVQQVEELESRLNAGEIDADETGDLTEAARKLNEIFAAAQERADLYMENARKSSAFQLAAARAQAGQIPDQSRKGTNGVRSAEGPEQPHGEQG